MNAGTYNYDVSFIGDLNGNISSTCTESFTITSTSTSTTTSILSALPRSVDDREYQAFTRDPSNTYVAKNVVVRGQTNVTLLGETLETRTLLPNRDNVSVSVVRPDGTNIMPSFDDVSRAGFCSITDGTNTMPTMDVAARPGYFDMIDRSSRDMGKVDIAGFDVPLPVGTNHIGTVNISDISRGEQTNDVKITLDEEIVNVNGSAIKIVNASGSLVDVYQVEGQSDNLDGKNALVTAANLYGRLSDSTVRPLQLDDSTHAIKTIEYEHAEIHSGGHFFIENFIELDAGESVDFCFNTTDSAEWIHLVWELESTGETLFQIWEAPTLNISSGSAVVSYNNNRNSAKTSNLTVRQDCDITGQGTLIAQTSFGVTSTPVKSMGGIAERSKELILKQNTAYVFNMSSASASNILAYLAEYYQHTDKD